MTHGRTKADREEWVCGCKVRYKWFSKHHGRLALTSLLGTKYSTWDRVGTRDRKSPPIPIPGPGVRVGARQADRPQPPPPPQAVYCKEKAFIYNECIACCPASCQSRAACVDSEIACVDGCYCPNGLLGEGAGGTGRAVGDWQCLPGLDEWESRAQRMPVCGMNE